MGKKTSSPGTAAFPKGKVAGWAYLLNLVGVLVLFFVYFGLNEGGHISNYLESILITACIAVIMATSLNLTLGLLGQLTLGCAGFEAVGAYTAALLSKFMVQNGWLADNEVGRFLLCVAAGGLMACLFGVLVGIPALRLRGDYLAIITLGFGEIIRVVIQNLKFAGGQGLAQGQAGQALVGIDRLSDSHVYVVFWIAVVTVAVVLLFAKSRFGRAVRAIRDDEIAASASGLNTTYYKVFTFALSALFAGVAGGVFAQHIGSLTPAMAGWLKSVDYVIMVVFGGMNSITGTIFSAVGLTFLSEILRAFSDYRMLVYSVVLILVMIFRPQGIFGRWEFSLSRVLGRIFRPRGGSGGDGMGLEGHAVLSSTWADPKPTDPAPDDAADRAVAREAGRAGAGAAVPVSSADAPATRVGGPALATPTGGVA